jgi:hypothetical protein
MDERIPGMVEIITHQSAISSASHLNVLLIAGHFSYCRDYRRIFNRKRDHELVLKFHFRKSGLFTEGNDGNKPEISLHKSEIFLKLTSRIQQFGGYRSSSSAMPTRERSDLHLVLCLVVTCYISEKPVTVAARSKA